MCGVMGDGPARQAVDESPRGSLSRAAPMPERRSPLDPPADAVIVYMPPRVNPSRDSTQAPVPVRLVTTGLTRPGARDGLTHVPVTTPVLVIEIVWPRVMVTSHEMGNARVGLMTVSRAGLADRVGADPVAEPCLAVPLALQPATIHATGLPTEPRGNPGEETTLVTHPSTPPVRQDQHQSTICNRARPLRAGAPMPAPAAPAAAQASLRGAHCTCPELGVSGPSDLRAVGGRCPEDPLPITDRGQIAQGLTELT
jgi:hypothetical protein